MKSDEIRMRILQALEQAKSLAFNLDNDVLIYFIDTSINEIFSDETENESSARPSVRIVSSSSPYDT